MDKTPNLGLNQPRQEDFYDVDVFNENAGILDKAVTDARIAADTAQDTAEGRAPLSHRHGWNQIDNPPPIPQPATTAPPASTNAAGVPGTSTQFARGDHRHPPGTPASHTHDWSQITNPPPTDAPPAAPTPAEMDTPNDTHITIRSWSPANLVRAVRGALLTGLDTTVNAAIVATDRVLVAFGKAQAQLNSHNTRITTAQATANQASTVAGNAQSTAGQAMLDAASAQETADEALAAAEHGTGPPRVIHVALWHRSQHAPIQDHQLILTFERPTPAGHWVGF
ncbi:MAG: hypothetical protein FWE08_06235, partial [Oscillospiraceae bacterium]|nr:hypothetical protein [Oscillospiraceae bacterium]